MAPTIRNVLEEIHRLVDDVRVRVHLAGATARAQWLNLAADLELFDVVAEVQPEYLAAGMVERGMELQERLRRLRARVWRDVDGVAPARARAEG